MISSRRARQRRIFLTECLISDQTGSIKIIWFNQPYLSQYLKRGNEIYISGQTSDEYLTLQFVNPLWEYAEKQQDTGKIIPIYPSTQNLSQKQLRNLFNQIKFVPNTLEDYLPQNLLNFHKLLSLSQALNYIHWPPKKSNFLEATRRLQFDELFFIALTKEKNKLAREKIFTNPIPFNQTSTKQMVDLLPFTLTTDQKIVTWEILQDIAKSKPMNRLLQGDVGSGKTIVAAIACLNTALAKKQSVILVPTEILAQQHYNTFGHTLKNFSLSIALFTRANKIINNEKTTKSELIKNLKNSKIDILIGTHAIIQEIVKFNTIGLLIVDEQHRFGVNQRHQLQTRQETTFPHFLSMTATPIPRTLALTVYGDLDISIIKTKPPGRKKIITKVVDESNRILAYKFIQNKILTGLQVYVICPLIDESDTLGVKSATQEYEKLTKKIFPSLRIGLLHGKLKTPEKQKVMELFKQKQIDILVSTSVIEVGIDIPNATIMMIEGADRFGLAQLHQFRGRVGRSDIQSYCLLFTDNNSQKTISRLQALTKYDNGLKLAEYDLRTRGSGEIYGTRQSGFIDLKIASLNDLNLIKTTKTAARTILAKSPNLELYPLLKKEYIYKHQQIYFE
jgi:ATP-dependent DNA helicase RecG